MFYAQRKISLVTFDMSGCGRSDGKYISLGINEKADLQAVIDQCKKRGYR